MKIYSIFYIAVLMLVTSFFVMQTAVSVSAQNIKLVDKKGKKVTEENLSRFRSMVKADGIVVKTNIKFCETVFLTNDERRLTRTLYYSDNASDTKRYFKTYISKSNRIIEKGEVRKNSGKFYERLILEAKAESERRYEIIMYNGEKSFVSIKAENLDLALEFENYQTVKNKQ